MEIASEELRLAVDRRKNTAFENLKSQDSSVSITVVVPVYNEATRMDRLGTKLQQLRDVEKASRGNVICNIVLVDEGSTDNTVEILHNIKKEVGDEHGEDKITITEIPDELKEYKTRHIKEKKVQMGGALSHGFRFIAENIEADFVIYTDFDDSVPMWEIGNALPHINGGVDVLIGSRREKDSAIERHGEVLGNGARFISVWKDLFPELGKVTNDTNGAFLVWKRELLGEIADWADQTKTYSPAFKTGALAQAVKSGKQVRSMGIAFIDVAEGSHFAGNDADGRLKVYARILKGLAIHSDNRELVEKIKASNEDEMLDFIAIYPLHHSLI